MKKFRLGLLFRIVPAIVLGIAPGSITPTAVVSALTGKFSSKIAH